MGDENLFTPKLPLTRERYLQMLYTLAKYECIVQFVLQSDEFCPDVLNCITKHMPLEQVTTELVSKWPGTVLLSGQAKAFRFNLTELSLNAVLEFFPTIFPEDTFPIAPEDLAIFSMDGEMILGSVTHERDFFLNASNTMIEKLLHDLPWMQN